MRMKWKTKVREKEQEFDKSTKNLNTQERDFYFVNK